jgi:hypothetical protein
MRAKFIYEKFKDEKSDPIHDMNIGPGRNIPGFTPMFVLKKQYPGMDWLVGTIFGINKRWSTIALVAYDEYGKMHGYTGWTLDYFEPWVGEFFDDLR